MNYKHLWEWESGLVNMIIQRHPEGFVDCIVTGDPGQGKSMYCYKAAAKVIWILRGYDDGNMEQEAKAYEEALRYIIFEPDDLTSLIYHNKSNRIISPIIVLDDASVHFGRQLYRLDPDLYMELESLTPTMRTASTGFLINTPDKRFLAKFFRDFCKHRMHITSSHEFRSWNRIARYYIKRYYPDDSKFRMYSPFDDTFSCFLIQPFYDWYYDKKMNAESKQAEKIHIRREVLRERRKKREEKMLKKEKLEEIHE